jgi:dihydroorotate dehydrogenase, subfamily 2
MSKFAMGAIYERLIRPLLFRLDPETAHHLAIRGLQLSSLTPLFWRLVQIKPNPKFTKDLFGLHFPNPVGLAAGFDKNAVALPAWAGLGFGFAEVGTITSMKQDGNPKPRIFRIAESEALINRLGFNNEGADGVALRLEALKQSGRWPEIPVGINLGKSKIIPLEAAAEDYCRAFRSLSHWGDYFALNVSSPNTPGLRQLQERDAIQELFSVVRHEAGEKPVLVKIAPDLDWRQMENVLEMAESHHLAGVIATNTTIDHNAVPAQFRTEGGLSGSPLQRKAMEVLQFVKQRSKLPVISVGGIMSADEALRRLDAGADLIQIYTGLIYRGPGLIREILKRIHTESNALEPPV